MKKHAPSVFEIQSPLQRRCYPMLWSFRVWKFEGSGMEFAIFHLVWLAFATPPMGMLKIRSTALIFCIFLHNFRNLTSRACNLQLCRYQSRSFWTSKDTDPHQHVSNKPQAQDQNPDFWWVVYSIFYLQKERERERKRNKNKIAWFLFANCCQLFRLQISILPDLYRLICCLGSHALDLFRTTAATIGFFVNTLGNQKLAAKVEFPDSMLKKNRFGWCWWVNSQTSHLESRCSKLWKLPQIKRCGRKVMQEPPDPQFQKYTGSDDFGLGNLTHKNGPLVRLMRCSGYVLPRLLWLLFGVFHDVI